MTESSAKRWHIPVLQAKRRRRRTSVCPSHRRKIRRGEYGYLSGRPVLCKGHALRVIMPCLSKTARPQISAVSLPVIPVCTGSPFCKDVRFHCVPICQFYYLGCAVLKVKPQLAPFAVVVHQIFVDSGGNRFTCFPTLRLPQRNCVCGIDLRCFCRARRKSWFSEIPISNGTTASFSSLASGKL